MVELTNIDGGKVISSNKRVLRCDLFSQKVAIDSEDLIVIGI